MFETAQLPGALLKKLRARGPMRKCQTRRLLHRWYCHLVSLLRRKGVLNEEMPFLLQLGLCRSRRSRWSKKTQILSGSTLRKFALHDFIHGLLRGHIDNLLHGTLDDFFHGLQHGDVKNLHHGALDNFLHGLRYGHVDNLLHGALDDFFHGLRHRGVYNLLHGALDDFLHSLRQRDVDNQSDLSRIRRGLDTRPCVGQISVWPAIR